MKVFLSSVRRGLEEERDAVAALLEAVGYEVVRFEDFGAVNATSRVACLGALADADAYVLLLGPHYGTAMVDSDLSPTEEEFNTARARGIASLVFKKAGVAVDEDQVEFCQRVGSYTDGRFWAEFDSIASLGPQVLSALRGLPLSAPTAVWRAVPAIAFTPVHATGGRRDGGQPQYSPILEVHVLPVQAVSLRAASASDDLTAEVMTTMRSTRFVGHADPLETVPDTSGVHVRRPSAPQRTGFGTASANNDPYRGLRLHRDGAAAAYLALPTDVLGSITDAAGLERDVLALLDQIVPFLPADAADIAVTACLVDEGRTVLGDPADVGRRTSGTLGYGQPEIVLPADQAVTADAMRRATQQVATEIAARVRDALRRRT